MKCLLGARYMGLTKKGQRQLGRWKHSINTDGGYMDIWIFLSSLSCSLEIYVHYTSIEMVKNFLLILTWHEHTEHRSFSNTQIWPLCLIFPSWMQSPVQFFPWGHRQSYPPSKLKQMVSLVQLCLPVPHSSISTAKKRQQALCLEYAQFQPQQSG